MSVSLRVYTVHGGAAARNWHALQGQHYLILSPFTHILNDIKYIIHMIHIKQQNLICKQKQTLTIFIIDSPDHFHTDFRNLRELGIFYADVFQNFYHPFPYTYTCILETKTKNQIRKIIFL